MSYLRQLAKESVIYGSSHVLSRVLNLLIVLPYLTRVFNSEPEQYGIHGIMYAYAALLMVLLTYGMETAFFRFASKSGQKELTFSTASISLIGSTLVFSAGLFLLAEPTAALLTRAKDAPYVQYFVGIIALDALSAIPFARLRLDSRPLRFAMIRLINILVNAGVLLFLLEVVPGKAEQGASWAAFYDPADRLHYVFLANLAASLVTFLLLLPQYAKMRLQFNQQLWGRMLRYAWPLLLVGIAGTINALSDRYLLRLWLPGNYEDKMFQVGIYNACIKYAVAMSLFTQAFRYAAEPFFFRQAEGANAKLVYARVAQAFTLVGCVAFLSVVLLMDVWQYIISASYQAGLGIVPIAMLAYLCLGIYTNVAIWYKVTDYTYMGALIAIVGVVVTLSVNYALIPTMGIYGPVWALLACYSVMLVLCYKLGQRYYPVPYRVKRMLGYVALTLFIFSVYRIFQIYLLIGPLSNITAGLVLLLVFALLIIWLERPTVQRLVARYRR